MFVFRLYVAGDAQESMLAVSNLTSLCRTYLPGRHEIEVVDVVLQPKRGLAESIMMTPTLVKLSPSPLRRIIGTLSHKEPVLQTLGLNSAPS